MSEITTFTAIEPTPANYFRSIVLFGRNVASYKFTLAKALVTLAREARELVTLEDLAQPFAAELCDHLRLAPKQGTSSSSRFLDTCRAYNDQKVEYSELIEETVRLGFNNVLDAFHVVGPGEIPVRFFEDERAHPRPGIRLTEAMYYLAEELGSDLAHEAEARWRLVETAWELGTSKATIGYESETGALTALSSPIRRRSVTSARHALNGYQRGRCFYCFRNIGIDSTSSALADVDHVFPHVLQRLHVLGNLDGVWNLVLACVTCNRGSAGKFDSTPHRQYVDRLHRRNEYLIASHHPLRETLLMQSGADKKARRAFLQDALDTARIHQVATWQVEPLAPPTF